MKRQWRDLGLATAGVGVMLMALGAGTVLKAQSDTARCELGGVAVPAFETRSISPEQFQSLHAAVSPRGDSERWTEIPWQSDLLAARRQAAQEGKPLLMWVMDGHPLGCT